MKSKSLPLYEWENLLYYDINQETAFEPMQFVPGRPKASEHLKSSESKAYNDNISLPLESIIGIRAVK